MIYIVILLIFFTNDFSHAKQFRIIAPSDPRITTHQLKSGEMTIGLTDNGGGAINQIILPGLGDIMDKNTDKYGRAGQVAIRDEAHGGRYNPTQAGFNESLGTQCKITQSEDKLVVEPRGMALWHGDGRYDFTEWENIGPDPYPDDGGNGDVDGLDEKELAGKQETEVHSEFDYYGIYENYIGKYGISTPTVRHYFEIRYIREPGHCINQFNKGTSAWNNEYSQKDISIYSPEGIHIGNDKDMNGLISVWSIRHDNFKWVYNFIYLMKKDQTWILHKKNTIEIKNNDTNLDNSVFILAESSNPMNGKAFGLYRPNTEINNNSIIGIDQKTNKTSYKDNRTDYISMFIDPFRTPNMSKYGWRIKMTGMLNRTRLPSGIYEALRNEYYILSGTPQEIMNSVRTLNRIKSITTPTFTRIAN